MNYKEDPPIIEHNPHEHRETNAIFWIAWTLVVLAWVGTGALYGFDWLQIGLGALTGLVLASWATEMTGNKVPESWRSQPRRR